MTERPDYSFARRPIWLAGAAIAVGMAALFVVLGMWQLSRHDERRELGRQVATRLAAPAAPLAAIDLTDGARFRRVVVTGRYVADEQVLIRNRSFRGSSGYHVVLPLVLDEGGAILVDRGFVTLADGDAGEYRSPPPGVVTIDGILLTSEQRGTFGPRDPEEGRLDVASRVDIARLQLQVDEPLAPLYLLLQDQLPTVQAGAPIVADVPDPGQGRHFGYALQWFLFAAIAVGGFVILVRRTATRTAGAAPDRPRPRLRAR